VPHYLVTARPKIERLPELAARLDRDEFLPMQPFGRALTVSLRGARQRPDGSVTWEEEDYCRPPLAQERKAVLDDYFEDLKIQLSRIRRVAEARLRPRGQPPHGARRWIQSEMDRGPIRLRPLRSTSGVKPPEARDTSWGYRGFLNSRHRSRLASRQASHFVLIHSDRLPDR
jgi:hypothetical protein